MMTPHLTRDAPAAENWLSNDTVCTYFARDNIIR
jgi:hypothetical protein